MIRMFSGLVAPALGWLAGLFRRDGSVSAHRIVLAATLAACGWGLWAGWAQWIILGEGVAGGGFGGLGTFAARWAVGTWLAIVLLWTTASPGDKDGVVGCSIVTLLFVSLIGTGVQAMHAQGAFAPTVRTRYRATVSCEHCGASCYVHVKIGESWTDWESVECCRCGIEVPPERMPEYAKSREAWDARVAPDGGGDGAED